MIRWLSAFLAGCLLACVPHAAEAATPAQKPVPAAATDSQGLSTAAIPPGVGGNTSTAGLKRLQRDVIDRKPGLVVVLCTIPPIAPEPYFTRHPRAPFDSAGGLPRVLEDYRTAARQP